MQLARDGALDRCGRRRERWNADADAQGRSRERHRSREPGRRWRGQEGHGKREGEAERSAWYLDPGLGLEELREVALEARGGGGVWWRRRGSERGSEVTEKSRDGRGWERRRKRPGGTGLAEDLERSRPFLPASGARPGRSDVLGLGCAPLTTV
jgi:hypothetical protein